MASCSCQRILMRRTRWLQRNAQQKLFNRHNSAASAKDFRIKDEVQQEPIISSTKGVKPKRDRFTVLRALASTVDQNVYQPPLNAIDDFFLLPDDPQLPLQAHAEGRKVAEQIISGKRYEGLTKFREPVPEWTRRAKYDGARDVEMLNDMLNDTKIDGRDIVKLYNELSDTEVDIPVSLHNMFLDYVGFHSLSSGKIEVIDPVKNYGDLAEHSEDRVVQMLSVPTRYSGLIIGKAQANLKRILDRTGCSLSPFSRDMDTMEDILWTMKGTIDQISACKKILYDEIIDWPVDGIKLQKQITHEESGQVIHTHDVTILSEYGRQIIGKQGETIRGIVERTGCILTRKSRFEPTNREVNPHAIGLWKLSGTPEQVEACTQHLRKIVRLENVVRPERPNRSQQCVEFSEEIFQKLLPEVDASTYEVFILTLLKHSTSTEAFKIFQDMNSKGYPGSKFLCNRLLSSIKSMAMSDVMEEDDVMEKEEEKQWQYVESITKHMNQHNISPDLETCNLILEIVAKLSSSADSLKAVEMLREMQKLNIAPNLESFLSVLQAEKSAVTWNMNLLTAVLDELETFSFTEDPNNSQFFDLAIELAKRSPDSSDIERITKKIDEQGVKITSNIPNVLL